MADNKEMSAVLRTTRKNMNYNESTGILSLPMQDDFIFRVHTDSVQDVELLTDTLERHGTHRTFGSLAKPEDWPVILKSCKYWMLSTTGGGVCNIRLATEQLVQKLGGEAEIKQAILLVTFDQETTIEKCDEFICTVSNAMPKQCWFRYSIACDMRPGRRLTACLLIGTSELSGFSKLSPWPYA